MLVSVTEAEIGGVIFFIFFVIDPIKQFKIRAAGVAQLSPSMAPHDSNWAKLGPERGTKQPIPPTLIKNLGIPQTFLVPTYKDTHFGLWCCNHKVDKKTEN